MCRIRPGKPASSPGGADAVNQPFIPQLPQQHLNLASRHHAVHYPEPRRRKRFGERLLQRRDQVAPLIVLPPAWAVRGETREQVEVAIGKLVAGQFVERGVRRF